MYCLSTIAFVSNHYHHQSLYIIIRYHILFIFLCCIYLPTIMPDIVPKLDDLLDLDNVGFTPIKEDTDQTQCDYIFAEDIDLNSNSMNILHWNICGLLNKQDGLTRLIRYLGGMNKVNVVCLNETWSRSETSDKVSILGYHFVSKHCQGKKGGWGVGYPYLQGTALSYPNH